MKKCKKKLYCICSLGLCHYLVEDVLHMSNIIIQRMYSTVPVDCLVPFAALFEVGVLLVVADALLVVPLFVEDALLLVEDVTLLSRTGIFTERKNTVKHKCTVL